MRISAKSLLLMIIIIALVIIDSYSIYAYFQSPPLPYVGIIGHYNGYYEVANAYKDAAILVFNIPPFSINLKAINVSNNKYIWSTTIEGSFAVFPSSTRINNELFILTYSSTYVKYNSSWKSFFVYNVTVINALNGRIINQTTIFSSPTGYYPYAAIVQDNIYILMIPVTHPKPANLTIVSFKVLDSEPYAIETWHDEIPYLCPPYSLGPVNVNRFGNYVLVTISCGFGDSAYYVLNSHNGKPVFMTKTSMGIYGVAKNTLIYQCPTGLCGLNLINNKTTWELPIIGNVVSAVFNGDEAIILTMAGYTVWAYGILSNGTLLFHRELWSYSTSSPCSGPFTLQFAVQSYLIKNNVLITIVPAGVGFIISPSSGCVPQSVILMNPINGDVLLSITKPTWIINSNMVGPLLFETTYLGNNYIVYVMSTYTPYTDTEEFTYYLTTPETITNNKWYYLINDTPYPITITTTLLIILAILHERKTGRRKRQF